MVLHAIQFGPLASIKKFISEAFLRYEAGFQKGIVKSMKPGERVRVIVVAGVDGFNCKHFVSPLVGGYLCYALLPAYGGERLVDIYGGDQDQAQKRNSGAHLNMVDPAIIFARGENFCNMQCNLTDVPAEWMDPEATPAALDGFSAPEMRDAAQSCGLPVNVGAKAATTEVNRALLLRLFNDPQNQHLLAMYNAMDPSGLTVEQIQKG